MWYMIRHMPALEAVDGEAVALAQLLLKHPDAVRCQVHGIRCVEGPPLACCLPFMVGVPVCCGVPVLQRAV